MKNVPTAAFGLEWFRIVEFKYKEPEEESVALEVKFDPSGEYDNSSGGFTVKFGVVILYGNDDKSSEMINLKVEALFNFNKPLAFSEIPPYFYRNSIAIIFPYVRSFVTTLTACAGVKSLILPVLNLSSLEETFKKNTTEISKTPLDKQ